MIERRITSQYSRGEWCRQIVEPALRQSAYKCVERYGLTQDVTNVTMSYDERASPCRRNRRRGSAESTRNNSQSWCDYLAADCHRVVAGVPEVMARGKVRHLYVGSSRKPCARPRIMALAISCRPMMACSAARTGFAMQR